MGKPATNCISRKRVTTELYIRCFVTHINAVYKGVRIISKHTDLGEDFVTLLQTER